MSQSTSRRRFFYRYVVVLWLATLCASLAVQDFLGIWLDTDAERQRQTLEVELFQLEPLSTLAYVSDTEYELCDWYPWYHPSSIAIASLSNALSNQAFDMHSLASRFNVTRNFHSASFGRAPPVYFS
ncbi:MAG: hypothetical protein HOP22_03305 [Nitrospiraceae bacterium]|nr:hypothetical protein [Nitrospiraceae bacterium]